MSAAIAPVLRAEFFVAGISVPKARPRVLRKTTKQGFAITYTPKTTVNWEKVIADEYRHQCPGIFFTREIPLRLYAEIVMPGTGPASTIRGDWENHAKSLCDALNTVAYDDDAQIVDGHAVKRRAHKGERPGVYILIEAVGPIQPTMLGGFLERKRRATETPGPWEKAS